MVFSSIDFLFKFLPIFLVCYRLCPVKWKNACLLMGSLLFYSYGVKDNAGYLCLFVFSLLVNYRIGVVMGNKKKKYRKKPWLIGGVLFNLFWLFLFKYAGFLMENVNVLIDAFGGKEKLPSFHPVLPVGISFYTFQQLSYLIDVYRRTVPSERSFVNYGMYISMFPQLIAGPIVTYSSIEKQIKKRRATPDMIEEGLREFTIGLGLKVLIANQVGGLWGEILKIGFESISTPMAWMGLIAFSLQLYFDFYGYSLMAVGLGLLLGFRLPQNFRHPYMALTMTDFWRRWHITLGSWFREYVYIPLGGNREGRWKKIRNLFVVWLLTGLWHGASWNFVLWGMTILGLILLEKCGLEKGLQKVPFLGHLYMLFAIPLTWMLFAITDVGQIGTYLQRLFPFLETKKEIFYYADDYVKYARMYGLSLAAGLIGMTNGPRRVYQRFKDSPITALLLLLVFWGCIYCIKRGMDDPFLYFRF